MCVFVRLRVNIQLQYFLPLLIAKFPRQTEIAKRLNAIIAQVLPFLSQEVSVAAFMSAKCSDLEILAIVCLMFDIEFSILLVTFYSCLNLFPSPVPPRSTSSRSPRRWREPSRSP